MSTATGVEVSVQVSHWRAVRVRLLLGALLTLLPAPALAASGPWHRWRGTPTGVFRTSTVSRGEWIATNGIGQALGADTDGKHRTDYFQSFDPQGDDPTHINRDLYNALTYDFFGAHRSTHNGDYTLPAGVPDGTGEEAEVRLAADRRFVYARFLWNSLAHDSDIATLTFGTPRSPVRPWPRWPSSARWASRSSVPTSQSAGTVRRIRLSLRQPRISRSMKSR